ncbi:hypothetical protein RRSWK_02144 [Rhodopirellula sp. SWK7]|nr:hypothetical protein RRSWK_02144 [Rhodopirellula sp. SWK7]
MTTRPFRRDTGRLAPIRQQDKTDSQPRNTRTKRRKTTHHFRVFRSFRGQHHTHHHSSDG